MQLTVATRCSLHFVRIRPARKNDPPPYLISSIPSVTAAEAATVETALQLVNTTISSQMNV